MSENKRKNQGFSDFEKSAIQERAKELAAESKANKTRAEGEKDVLAAIAKLEGSDHSMALKIHKVIKENAPELSPKTWYGMPAYALNDKVVCFFQGANKFKTRYASLGFNDSAKLDNGEMWPVAFAIKKLGLNEEKKIVDLIKRALGS